MTNDRPMRHVLGVKLVLSDPTDPVGPLDECFKVKINEKESKGRNAETNEIYMQYGVYIS